MLRFPYFMSACCFLISACRWWVVYCKGADTTVCHHNMDTFLNENSSGPSLICVVSPSWTSAVSWKDADKFCRKHYSFLLDLNTEFYNSSKLVEYLISEANEESELIWVGMRKISGFYFWDSEKPSLFKEKKLYWGNTWLDSVEPIYDCVAFSPRNGTLVTQNCSSSFRFVCMNHGYSTKPIASPLCTEDWKFMYHFDNDRDSCYHTFAPQNYNQSVETCTENDGKFISDKDYQGYFEMLETPVNNTDFKGFWNGDLYFSNGISMCRTRISKEKESDTLCSDRLNFVCKQRSRPSDVEVWIQKSDGNPPGKSEKGNYDASLTCKVSVNGTEIPDNSSALRFQWIKNGAPVGENNSGILPRTVFDETMENGNPVSRQGSYQCKVQIAGLSDYILSDEADVFFSDVSSYIVIFQGMELLYNISDDLTRYESIDSTVKFVKENLITDSLMNELNSTFGLAEWDFRGVRVENGTAKVNTFLFLNWSASSEIKQPKNVIKMVSNILDHQDYGRLGVEWTLESADTCFEEKLNVSLTKEVVWPETQGTAEINSVPGCFDEQGNEIKRTCRASMKGAHWLPLPENFTCKDPPEKDECDEEETEVDNPVVNSRKLNWPATAYGKVALPHPLCFTGERIPVARRCLRDSVTGFAYWNEVQGTCNATEISNLTNDLRRLSSMDVNSENVSRTVEELHNLTSSKEKLDPVDLFYVVKTLENIASAPSKDHEVIRKSAMSFDNAMKLDPNSVIKMQSVFNTSNRITDALERIVATSTLGTGNSTLLHNGKTLNIKIWDLTENVTDLPTGVELSSAAGSTGISTLTNGTAIFTTNTDAAISLPMELIVNYSRNAVSLRKERRISFIIYKNLSLYHVNSSEDNLLVNSFIIHARLGEEKFQNLDPPVTMIFKPLNVSESLIRNMSCGFWDQSLNRKNGGWSTDGCNLHHNGSFFCTCNHLTNFALLLSLESDNSIPPEHRFALEIITYIGCGLSIFGLGVTVLTYLIFRKWRKGKKRLAHQALCNLSAALVVLLVIFIGGINRKEPHIGCKIIAVLLHYFMLASFAWMLVEALLNYLNFVKVFDIYIPRFMKKAMFCAWGFPIIIVAVVLSIDHEMYGENKNSCWISNTAFPYALALPVGLLLTTNVIVFIMILFSIFRKRDPDLGCNQSDVNDTRVRLRASVCIFILLGLSWVFGFLAVSDARLVFQYIFTITTTLQGFYIFVYCVLNEKAARELWKDLLFPSSKQTRRFQNSHSTGAASMTHITSKNHV